MYEYVHVCIRMYIYARTVCLCVYVCFFESLFFLYKYIVHSSRLDWFNMGFSLFLQKSIG